MLQDELKNGSAPVIGEGRTRRLEVRGVLWACAALVLAFLVSLIVRDNGSYYTPIDGWGVDLFELSMGGLCILRYFNRSWRTSQSAASIFPLVIGGACCLWAMGDVVHTVEALGGASVMVPSAADGFYLSFFPACYLALMVLIRRGNHGSLLATSLDGLVGALGVAALSAAFLFQTVLRATDGGVASTATSMAYPIGDVLLLVLAVGGLAVLSRHYRTFFGIVAMAMAINLVGDMFNLLQPNSKVGYIANAVVWPISLLCLAIATWILPATVGRPIAEKAVDAERGTERTAGYAIPALGAIAGMLVLVVASIGHMGKPAVGLAAATLVVCGVRLAFTVREAQSLNTARFRSLVDNAWDLIVVSESDFSIAYVTPSSERVLGYAPEELRGQLLSDLAHPDDAHSIETQLGMLAGGTTRTVAFETRLRHRSGEWRTIGWTATNLLDVPAVRGYVLNGGDVTEARRASEDLAAARDGALMASKAKSDFLSTMSHEIRTPMNGVIGLTDLLLETALDADQHELASGIKVSAENLLVIINDILDFSKIEAGRLEIEEIPFDVTRVADDVGRILAGSASAKGLELLIDVHPDVPTELYGDGIRIQQVLLNLGSNGVKFTSEGEVVLRISVLDEKVDRVALRFDVIDMGIGIAASDQARLFRPFAQADSSTTRKYGGTGLGLAICRQLVELMGGRLGLISEPGEGSTFWFELSLRRDATAATLASADAALGCLDGKRALVVDDNATNRKILRQQLASWSVEVVEAIDGYEAVELASAAAASGHPFDVGVLDLNMPGMDGIELASILKANDATSSTLLYLLSSSGDHLGAGEAHLRGFEASLTKPVRPSELFDSLITGVNHQTPVVRHAAGLAPQNLETKGMILLVEDNTMNQLVGSKVLAKLGFEFQIAGNGLEAVEHVSQRDFDAVLMDCQMPEMDGYEATAAIRRSEGDARHTPIIAMTAAAMEGDRETCLAAGMDDYITKPIRLEALAEVIHRWVPVVASTRSDEPSSSSHEDTAPLDADQIELLRSLDDGDGAVLGEIIDQYLLQTTEGREELARVVLERDTQGLQRVAHAVRGASANIGACALADVCEEIEVHADTLQLDAANELVARFDVEFARVKDALNGLLVPSG